MIFDYIYFRFYNTDSVEMSYGITKILINIVNPLSANPTKWSNTLKQFVSNSG